MILQARRLWMVVRSATLVVTTVLMLAFAGPVSYALHDDNPKPISDSRYLYDEKGEPIDDMYANISGVPDLAHAFASRELLDTRYWIPLGGYDNRLIITTDDSRYLFPYDYNTTTGFTSQAPLQYTGKITPLKNQADADEIVKSLAKQGVAVDKEKAQVLNLNEKPSEYRPMVPVMPVLAWMWGAAAFGLLQFWRRKRAQQGVVLRRAT